MYFIIAIWGGPRRGYAAIKFMIYTLIGSVLMLLGILTLYYQHYTQFQALQLRHRRPDAHADSRRHAVVGVLGVLPRLRRQGADVPVPHLAAGRAHRSAHRRLRRSWPASC